jgi:hypothetical protein
MLDGELRSMMGALGHMPFALMLDPDEGCHRSQRNPEVKLDPTTVSDRDGLVLYGKETLLDVYWDSVQIRERAAREIDRD